MLGMWVLGFGEMRLFVHVLIDEFEMLGDLVVIRNNQGFRVFFDFTVLVSTLSLFSLPW